jgi:hypothetical protein
MDIKPSNHATFPQRISARFSSLVLLAVLGTARLPAAPTLQLGTAAVPITPPAGIALAGYYHERGSEGTADDIYVKSMVLDDGETCAGIVVCDLISMPKWIVSNARRQIEKQCPIPGSNVLIAATHTHTAPVLLRQSIRDELDGAARPVSRDYSASLAQHIADAVSQAFSNRQPVRISTAVEREEQLAFNRRYWMRDGTVGWNPGKLNQNIVRPAGPTDPEVGVLYAETATTRPAPVVTLVNFAMHPDTTGGTRISADFPGVLARQLGAYKGAEMLTLFANGTCGNVNHVNVRWPDPQKGIAEAHRTGTVLAAAVLKAYSHLEEAPASLPLRVRSARLALPLPSFTEPELSQARLDIRTARDNTRDGFMKLVRAHRILDTAAQDGKPMEVEVQVIALGQAIAWVSWPGEMFVELGLNVKRDSPFRYTYNIELANGAIGYIPNRAAYAEGNYEVESARVAEGSGEMLATAALGLLRELHGIKEEQRR